MASKKPKTTRKRLTRASVDVRNLPGPFYITGSIGDRKDRLADVREPVWFDPVTKKFILADGKLAFDAMPSAIQPLVMSARAQERATKQKALIEAQNALNKVQRSLEIAIKANRPEAIKKFRAQALKARKAREEAQAALEPLLTSTDKISALPYETRKVPRGREKELNILTEYSPKDGMVKFFFAGAGDDVKGVDPDMKCRDTACLLVSPAVRATLARYTDSEAENRGEHGYFAVSKWDYPKVINQLSKIPGVSFFGAPELDLAKEFKSLDDRARRVDAQTIVWGRPPFMGSYEDGSPANFQEDGVRFLMSRDHAILADDMGLGKTSQAIVAANNAVPKEEQILVLCPAAVAANWIEEIRLNAPGAPSLLLDTAEFRKTGAPPKRGTKLRFIVCSYQGASSLNAKAEVAKFLMDNQWGLIILDEAHRLKKPGTLGHKFVDKLKTKRMWFLTGTPIANHVIDFYGLLKLAKHHTGKRLDLFVEKYVPSYVTSGHTAATTEREKLLALGKALTGLVLRRTKEEVLKALLPKKVGGLATGNDALITIELPTDFSRTLLAAKEKKVSRERLRHYLAVAKVPATWEVSERVLDGGGKLVIFSTYTDVLQALEELVEKYTDPKGRHILSVTISGGGGVVGKGTLVKLFQGKLLDANEAKWAKAHLGQWFINLVQHVPTSDWKPADLEICRKKYGKNEAKWPDKVSVVLGQMVAASEGVTLTKADTLLFNDLDYMPSRHEQAEDRIYRISMPKAAHPEVFIGYMFAKDPLKIDREIYEGLGIKRAEIQDVYGEIGLDYKTADKNLRKKYEDSLKGVSQDKYAAEDRLRAARKKRNPSLGL